MAVNKLLKVNIYFAKIKVQIVQRSECDVSLFRLTKTNMMSSAGK